MPASRWVRPAPTRDQKKKGVCITYPYVVRTAAQHDRSAFRMCVWYSSRVIVVKEASVSAAAMQATNGGHDTNRVPGTKQ